MKMHRRQKVAANVLQLGEEADFEALNCLPALYLKEAQRFI
jgi:hypothetical protein